MRVDLKRVFLLLTFAGCNYYEQVPVIGVDEKGNPTQVFIPKKEYSKRVTLATSSIEESIIPVLMKRDSNPPLQLRTISMGVGVNTEIGIGPFRIGALPRFRLIFSNSSNLTNVP